MPCFSLMAKAGHGLPRQATVAGKADRRRRAVTMVPNSPAPGSALRRVCRQDEPGVPSPDAAGPSLRAV